jgi:hypothetical protein
LLNPQNSQCQDDHCPEQHRREHLKVYSKYCQDFFRSPCLYLSKGSSHGLHIHLSLLICPSNSGAIGTITISSLSFHHQHHLQ